MKRASIATFDYRHGGLDHIFTTIRELGQRTGRAKEAQSVVAGIESRIAAVKARVAGKPRPRTLLVFSREARALRNVYVSGGRGFLHDMLVAAGGQDVFGDVGRESLQATTETILARAPEVILELRSENIPVGKELEAGDAGVVASRRGAGRENQARLLHHRPADDGAGPARGRRHRANGEGAAPVKIAAPKILVSWSTGKDSAWMLHMLNQQHPGAAAGLLTTTNEAFDRVAMHAVRRELLNAQAEATGPAAPRAAVAVAVFQRAVRSDHAHGRGRVRPRRLHARGVRRSVSRRRSPVSRDPPGRQRTRTVVSDLENQADHRSRARHDRRRPPGAADLRQPENTRSQLCRAHVRSRRCWTICRPASIRAARMASSIRSRSPARCSTTRSVTGSAKSLTATDLSSPMLNWGQTPISTFATIGQPPKSGQMLKIGV